MFEYLALFYGCTAQFVSDLVGNAEDWISLDTAHIYLSLVAIEDRVILFLMAKKNVSSLVPVKNSYILV